MMHFYGFTQRPGVFIPYYERSFPNRRTAYAWATQAPGRFFMIDRLPPNYWY